MANRKPHIALGDQVNLTNGSRTVEVITVESTRGKSIATGKNAAGEVFEAREIFGYEGRLYASSYSRKA